MDKFNHFQISHKSIIKEIKPTESLESDCISIDNDNHHGSSIVSSHTNTATQTIPDCIPTTLCCNNNEISSENVYQRSILLTSQSLLIRPNSQRFNRDQIRSRSPSPYDKTNEHEPDIPIRKTRSHSFENLSLSPLRETTTRDSGTGDSITQLPTEIPTKPIHYEIVPVFGLDKVALMANRYDFDPSKVFEYRPRKRNNPGPKNGKSTKSIIETTSKASRRDSNESKKSTNVLLRLFNSFKSSPPNETSFQPIVRHHPSKNLTDENQ